MAKKTGQITVLKNNTVTNVEHQIRFIFTKENGERITRDTTSKGAINFDIPNGEWNVSWFAVDGDQKVLPLRAGLQLKITSSTPATALADWIYGGNTHVADPILTQWTTVLDEMKAVRDQFRDETQQDGTGKFVKQSSVKKNFLDVAGRYTSQNNDVPILKQGDSGLAMGRGFLANNPGLDFSSVGANVMFLYYEVQLNFSNSNLVATFKGYNSPTLLQATKRQGEAWSTPVVFYGSQNTIIDSNGNYKPASPVIQLHHNKVEYNEDFDKDNPPQLEHVETGAYRITNVREICKDGWTFNKPINGKGQPFFMIKYEQEDSTTLLVRVFERTFNSKTGEFGFGEPRDIGADERWIDFHFEVDHERIAREEAQMQKEQEEFEEQERLRKEAEERAEKEAQEVWEAEMARQEAEMLAEMEAEHKEE